MIRCCIRCVQLNFRYRQTMHFKFTVLIERLQALQAYMYMYNVFTYL